MEDPANAEFKFLFLVQASRGVELESSVDGEPPVFLFDRKDGYLSKGLGLGIGGCGLCAIIRAMSGQPCRLCFAFAMFLMGAAAVLAQDAAAELLREGRQLDLIGEYSQARERFQKALQQATTAQAKALAQRSLAVSYGFERDCKNAVKYEGPLYETYLASKSFFEAGETADELARICIDAGDLDQAYQWYQKGHDAGLNELEEKQKDLWNFRWEHAQARIAARRGNKAEAQKHVEAAKAVLDRGTNPQQSPFFPYLVGYVAFYADDFKTALAEFQKANQNDPFIQVMIAQTYEKLGDQAHAREYYLKALASSAHNPPNAFARPLAKKKTG